MNVTYIDDFIHDGEKETLSLKNFYSSYLVGDANDENHIFRTPWEDFFLKYKDELDSCIQWRAISQDVYYNPKMLSMTLYGTTEMWLAIMRANGFKNITEFHYPFIKVYNPDVVMELIKIFFKREGKV